MKSWTTATVAPQTDAARPYAVCLTATSRADKQWPVEHWRAMLARLRAPLSMLYCLGAAKRTRHVRNNCSRFRPRHGSPRAPLNEVAQTLAGARVVIGVDTGLAHLAVALSRPTVGIYVTTVPGLTGLFGRVDCINLGRVARCARAAPVEAVWSAVAECIGEPLTCCAPSIRF